MGCLLLNENTINANWIKLELLYTTKYPQEAAERENIIKPPGSEFVLTVRMLQILGTKRNNPEHRKNEGKVWWFV